MRTVYRVRGDGRAVRAANADRLQVLCPQDRAEATPTGVAIVVADRGEANQVLAGRADHREGPIRTKAIAERAVLAANGPGLATTALRPHLIWGPGDNHLVPRLIERSRKLRRFGPSHTKIDATYIDNAAAAHLAAADRLAPGAAPAGRAYFVSNGEPIHVWDLLDRILAAAELPPIQGNPGKLQQVFLNLLLNAKDAMPGGGRLRVATRYNGHVEAMVADSGSGIAPEHLKRIYDPFFTTKTMPKPGERRGTGLGLAVSYGIIQEHSGKIHVESAVGSGTTFHLEFPLIRKSVHA